MFNNKTLKRETLVTRDGKQTRSRGNKQGAELSQLRHKEEPKYSQ
jgi:hypothetical protein